MLTERLISLDHSDTAKTQKCKNAFIKIELSRKVCAGVILSFTTILKSRRWPAVFLMLTMKTFKDNSCGPATTKLKKDGIMSRLGISDG